MRLTGDHTLGWSSAMCITIALLLAGHSGVAAEQVPSIEGIYARSDPSPSAVRVATRPDGRFRVEIHGSGDQRMGAGAGADCYAVAEGVLTDDRLGAAFVPFTATGFDFSAADTARHPRRLEVRFDGQDIEVSGDFDYCALNTYLAGRYRRMERSQRFENCPPGVWPCRADK
jgi:hypothetical protein